MAGVGARTSPGGVDFLIDHYKNRNTRKHIIVQELPKQPESFIHLDMVFSFVSNEECLVYEPLILEPNKFQTIHIEIDNGKVKIRQAKNLVNALTSGRRYASGAISIKFDLDNSSMSPKQRMSASSA